MNFIKTHKFFVFCIFLGMCAISNEKELPFLACLVLGFLIGCLYYYIFKLPIKLFRKVFKTKEIIKMEDIKTNNIYLNKPQKVQKEISSIQKIALRNSPTLAKAKELQIVNPKFSRSSAEEKLSSDFSEKYQVSITMFENEIYEKTQKARKELKSFNFNNILNLHEEAVNTFYKFQDFCFNKGNGGKIYFEDMWLHCHNSKNVCFSYIEETESVLEDFKLNYDTYKKYYEKLNKTKDKIKKLIDIEQKILQSDLYKRFEEISSTDVRKIIKNLEDECCISKEKYYKTYLLKKCSNHFIQDTTNNIASSINWKMALTSTQETIYQNIVSDIKSGKQVIFDGYQDFAITCIDRTIMALKDKKEIERAVDILLSLKKSYGFDNKVNKYATTYLADCFCLLENYSEALKLYQEIKNISMVLSLKYKLGEDITAEDFIYLANEKSFSSFVYNKFEKIKHYCEQILNKTKGEYGLNYLTYFGNEYKQQEKRHIFFAGNLNSNNINSRLNAKGHIKYLDFTAIDEFVKFCNNICREAENILREEMGIPKVGEGWVSETELYYKIKEFVSSYEVVHHYRDKWLGRQHLDIYIPKLKLAFEYQGLQHSKPIDFFGGEKAFIENQKRDEEKKKKCKQEKVHLVEVYPDYDFDYIKNIIKEHL